MDLITFLLLFIIWLILFYYRISSCFCFWFIWWVEDLKNPMNNSPHEVGIWRIPGGDGTKSCPTLFHLMDCSPPGSSFHGIFQARILKWVAIPFSKESFQLKDPTGVSHTVGRLFTLSHYGRLGYWGALPCPLLGVFPIQESNPGLWHCRWILYHWNHQGSPRILE